MVVVTMKMVANGWNQHKDLHIARTFTEKKPGSVSITNLTQKIKTLKLSGVCTLL